MMHSVLIATFIILQTAVCVSSSYSVRLVDGTKFGNGKLQIGQRRRGYHYNYQYRWYFYCRNWGMHETRVVCRQLGFSGAVSTTPGRGRSTADGNSYEVSNEYFNCDGDETRISSCSTSCCGYNSDCDYVFITCTNTTAKPQLVDGSSANVGRIGFKEEHKWISVRTWTISEAKVTCRQLGFVDGAISVESQYSDSQSSTCYSVKCSGWEPTLNDCSEHHISSSCESTDYGIFLKCHPNRRNVQCHCLESSECNRTTGSCPDNQCAVGWTGKYCQIELPKLLEPPTITYGQSKNNPIVTWKHPIRHIESVVGYRAYYIDTSQIGNKQIKVCSVGVTTSCRLSTLAVGRKLKIGVSCLIKTGSTTTPGPLSPTINYTTSVGETEMDFVLMNYSPVIDFDNPESSLKIGGYTIGEHQTNNVNFGRKIDTDTGSGITGRELRLNDDGDFQSNHSMFPTGSTVLHELINDFAVVQLELPPNVTSENIGVFYSWATTGLLTSNISTFSVAKDAKIQAKNRTILVGFGEGVELVMDVIEKVNINELRWRHNGGEILNDWNGQPRVVIESVRTTDGGIYECYIDGERELGLQGIIQLIIRECPFPKWGPECDNDCPVCYNGGVCDAINGSCLCPPGFMSEDCSEACGDNNWGRSCSAICSSSERGCDSILFCLTEPVGCSCMAGYKGVDCKELCPYGTFGADCRSTCHCKFNACDRAMGCMNITCDDGFTGPQCQEYEDSNPCPDGYYGILCQYKCHCSSTLSCFKNGTCPMGCQEGWGGDDCQFAIPALRNAPRISKSNFHSLHLEWDEWTVYDDYGLGNVTGYRLYYRYITPSLGARRTGEYTEGTSLVLSRLNPCRRYEIYIRAYRMISGELFIGRPSPSVFHDMECDYGSLSVTLMAQPAVIDIVNKTDDIGIFVYSGALSTNIRLERTCDTGAGINGRPVSWFDGSPFPGSHVLPTMMFPTNTLIETIAEFDYHALIAKIPGESQVAKVGAFSADILGIWALPSQSTVIILDKNVNPHPVERSVVVGTGDQVILSVVVEGNATGLRWRHNGNGIKQWKDNSTIVIEHARTKDSGIYECHFLAKRNQGIHAVIDVIVKDCPLGKHGTACDLDCPICYNGGVCDSRTSLCVCPSGFTGSNCSEVCQVGYWGQDCSFNCDNRETGCIGNLFCPASPLGCACLPGFKGIDCKEVCSNGFYGADCKQICNCPSSSCDPVAGCSPDSCFPGFYGPQCQEHDEDMLCSAGTFGPLCNRQCNCKYADSCFNNGTCTDGICGDEWGGHDCQIALPYFMNGPTLMVSANRREITVNWFDWSFGRDFGTGPVVSYEILYTDSADRNYITAGTTTDTTFVISKLRPGKQYSVAIKCLRYVDGLITSGPASPASAVSTCKLTEF